MPTHSSKSLFGSCLWQHQIAFSPTKLFLLAIRIPATAEMLQASYRGWSWSCAL